MRLVEYVLVNLVIPLMTVPEEWSHGVHWDCPSV